MPPIAFWTAPPAARTRVTASDGNWLDLNTTV
jgi:hypothetical protein